MNINPQSTYILIYKQRNPIEEIVEVTTLYLNLANLIELDLQVPLLIYKRNLSVLVVI